MTKSQIFKSAHKLAKAFQVECGGDYIVYLSLAIKAIYANLKKGRSPEDCFAAMNRRIKKVSCDLPLITREVKVRCTHGLREFDAHYKLEKARKELEDGQFFGKEFTKGRMICAYVTSFKVEQVAY